MYIIDSFLLYFYSDENIVINILTGKKNFIGYFLKFIFKIEINKSMRIHTFKAFENMGQSCLRKIVSIYSPASSVMVNKSSGTRYNLSSCQIN